MYINTDDHPIQPLPPLVVRVPLTRVSHVCKDCIHLSVCPYTVCVSVWWSIKLSVYQAFFETAQNGRLRHLHPC